MVVRAIPVTSLTKEKKVAVQYLAHLDQWLQEGLQLRSCTFQLIKLAFDEEVTPENIDTLRKMINKIRHPPDVFHHFAFTGQVVVSQTPLHKGKEKNATLRGLAKKTLLKTARKAGFKQKTSSKRQKYVLPNIGMNSTNKYLTSPGRMNLPDDFSHEDDLSVDDFEATPVVTSLPTDAKTLERLAERSYVKDWKRLGLKGSGSTSPAGSGKTQEQFRLTTVNSAYLMCRRSVGSVSFRNFHVWIYCSYPALLVMPSSVPDESIQRICRCYRQGRIPCITWRHPRTKALLLRGAGHHGKSVMGMLKSHPTPAASTETTSSFEHVIHFLSFFFYCKIKIDVQINFVSTGKIPIRSCIGNAGFFDASELCVGHVRQQSQHRLITLSSRRPINIHFNSGSQSSLESLQQSDGDYRVTNTHRSNKSFLKKINFRGVFPRSSGGKGPKNFGRWGSLKDRRQSSQASLTTVQQSKSNVRHSNDVDVGSECAHTLQKAALYILGEKAQMKGVKVESAPKTDFIPVEYCDVRHTKTAFKKLMRACVPSSQSIEPEQSFNK